MAPEVVRGSGHGLAADWWSLGVLTHVLVAGASPWHLRLAQQQNEMLTYQRITAHAADAIKLRGLRSTVLPAQDLINDLMHPTPQDRLGVRGEGIAELQAHAFFGGLDWHALAEATLPSPLAPFSDDLLLQLCPPGAPPPQANPEEGIETEPCPPELLCRSARQTDDCAFARSIGCI